MARLARLVLPDIPHHITQRGNRRETVFFNEGDYRAYLELLATYAQKSGTKILAYCLMPNHVHLVAIPSHEDGLRAMLGETHRRYTARINARNKWTGHLWQGRFGSVAMDEAHTAQALRYVLLNPLRAKLVSRPIDWKWSSARAMLKGTSDAALDAEAVADWRANLGDFLHQNEDESFLKKLRNAETIGRPIGSDTWLAELEKTTGRTLAAGKRGRQASNR